MKFGGALIGLSLLLAGCVYHRKAATYETNGRDRTVYAGNWKVFVHLAPTVQMTPYDSRGFSGRLSAVTYNSENATGPYSLRVIVSANEIDNGIPVEVRAAELRFASGETRTILSRQDAARKAITQQRPANPSRTPAQPFSQCEFIFPLGDQLVFKADELVRVIATIRIAGLPQEVDVDVEFKGTYVNDWGSTLRQI